MDNENYILEDRFQDIENNGNVKEKPKKKSSIKHIILVVLLICISSFLFKWGAWIFIFLVGIVCYLIEHLISFICIFII